MKPPHKELNDYIISNSPTIRKNIEQAYEDYLKNGGVTLDFVIEELKKGRKEKLVHNKLFRN